MSIEKHPTKAGYYVKSYPDGRNGKQHRDYVDSWASAIALDELLKKSKAPLARTVHPRMQDVVENYMAWVKENQSPRTYANKESRLEKHVIPSLGHYRVKELSQVILDEYRKGKAMWTYYGDICQLQALITWMVKRGYAEKLTWIMELPTGKHAVKPVPHPADIVKAIDSIPNETQRTMFYLMLYSGLRWNECRLLRFEDVDLPSNTIRVKEVEHAEQDIITIPAPLIEWFKAHYKPSGYVFPSGARDKPYNRLDAALRKAGAVAGIKLTSHTFRHASATYLYEQEKDIYAVQAHLRHKKVTQSQVYARMSISNKNHAVASVVDFVVNNQLPD